jgi:4-hydroxybenzoate polyprenyltransferase
MKEIIKKLPFFIKTSRPGLWFPTIWLYLLPLSGQGLPFDLPFVLGLFYVGYPLNLLIYGWNDLVDADTDDINPRKDSYLFGARGNDDEREMLRLPVSSKWFGGQDQNDNQASSIGPAPFVASLLFGAIPIIGLWIGMIILGGIKLGVLFILSIAICALYNHPTAGWRQRPGLDLLSQVGYLIVPLLSSFLNELPYLDLSVWIYLALFCAQSQLIGEVMDIEPDSEVGRKTTAVTLGRMNSKYLILFIVLVESVMMGFVFNDWIFAGGLGLLFLWLLLDAFILFKGQNYNMTQFRLFGVGSNIMAVMSMIYIFKTGLFSTL